MADEYPYNDDLLTGPSDQERARAEFPDVAFAFIFPEMLEVFARADAEANRLKHVIRFRGLLSIALVTVSLIMASASPLFEQVGGHWQAATTVLAAVLGVSGGAIAFFTRPRPWLETRLVTERLRQFHFSLMIELAPDLLQAAATQDTAPYRAKRLAALAAFEQNVVRRKAEVLETLIEDPEPAGGEIKPLPPAALLDGPTGAQLLAAYRELRLLRQRQYADHKLRRSGGMFSAFPRAQAGVLGTAGVACIGLLFVLDIGAALMVNHPAPPISPLLHATTLSIAVVALAIRTLEEGLKPRTEIERYRHYQAAARRLLAQFDNGDTAAKLDAVAALERAAFDEMGIFMRAHEEARFSM